MKKKVIICLLLLVVLFLVGCSNKKYQFNTLSGKPEAIIAGVEKSKVINRLNNEMLKQDYIIEKTSEYKIVYEKDVKDLLTSAVYGSDFNSTPRYRIIMNIIEYKSKIRIISTLQIVTNPGSAYKSIEDITHSKSGEKYYKILQEIKKDLE